MTYLIIPVKIVMAKMLLTPIVFDPIEPKANSVALKEIVIRMGFLRKVYGILSLQLLITTIIAGSIAYNPIIHEIICPNTWLIPVCQILSIISFILLVLEQDNEPFNYILLGICAMLQAVTIGFVINKYKLFIVLYVCILTLFITFNLMLYAFQTTYEFSIIHAGLFNAAIIVVWLGIMNIVYNSPIIVLILCGAMIYIYSLFIILDTQRLMKEVYPEDYILATINLYTDILIIFLELIRNFKTRK